MVRSIVFLLLGVQLAGCVHGPMAINRSYDFALTGAEDCDGSTPTQVEPDSAHEDLSLLMKIHFALGTVALATFSSALVLGAWSGNLEKLSDPTRCCPDGGDRNQAIRTVDRVLVNTGIVSYVGAGGIALYSLLFEEPPWDPERKSHRSHRWSALAHLAIFAVSATTGIIMSTSQPNHPDRFATASRIHVAANVMLVPLLSVSLADILWD